MLVVAVVRLRHSFLDILSTDRLGPTSGRKIRNCECVAIFRLLNGLIDSRFSGYDIIQEIGREHV